MKPGNAFRWAFRVLAAAASLLAAAAAAETEIANAPLFTATAVKPNIMFLMDDSDSMRRNWLPDRSVYWAYSDRYGQWSTHCNHMAYNPAATYASPVTSAGVPLPNADLAGFGTQFYYVYTGTQPDMGFSFLPDGEVVWNDFMYECNSQIGSAPGSSVFTKVTLTASSAEAQNYANWKKFYSVRREMAKTALKQVFARLDSNYRVGFSVTSNPDAEDNSGNVWWPRWGFIDVRDFDAAQKERFFQAIDKSDGGADTPLRGAIAKTGQYFARKARGQTHDPMQRSCQRNFAILATDGGWTRAGENPSGISYGALALDNASPVGQRDSGASVPRPLRDAGADSLATLADVAAYYYATDLRSAELGNCTGSLGGDVCKDDVPSQDGDAYQSYGDAATWQHLTLFTMGMGLNGTVKYRPDYTTARSGDFHEIVTGARNWPAIGDPGSQNDFMPLSHTDDMWHAAVNARGRHFSANDPASIASSIGTALDLIRASTGAGASASTSSLQPVEGDNDVYLAQFTSQKWTGDVLAFKIDPDTGEVSSTRTWSAREQLDSPAVTAGSRRILYRRPSAGPGDVLREFTASNLAADGLGTHFSDFCAKAGAGAAPQPEQCGSLKGAQLAAANNSDNLVAYLRGEHALPYYRARESRLGDIINASPVFVGKPGFPYADASYQQFKQDKAGRTAVVLAAANDGMLHAFERATGRELWAYVPGLVMGKMYKLADTNYANNHVYLVDGSPQVADIKVGSGWKTIVVGGLNAGGRGYYALDITDPANPKALWEFTEADLGYTFGNPIVVSRNNASRDWVVVFGSGYRNANPGDGAGHLFVLDAATGALRKKLDAGPGSEGIAKINVWVDDEADNVAARFYGGDLNGNLWRFDIDGRVDPPGDEAFLLATLKDQHGNRQPVTTRPALAELKINGARHAVVYVGTGRYLGIGDVSDKAQQTLYAIKDPLLAVALGDVRSRADIVQQTATVTTDGTGRKGRSVEGQPVDWSAKIGWYVDLPASGERITVDPVIALDRLSVAANVPAADTCLAGGSSHLYSLNIVDAHGSSTWQSGTLILGFTTVQRKNGALDDYVTGADGTLTLQRGTPASSSAHLRRISWREIVD